MIASVLEPESDVPGVLKQALEVQKLMLDNLDEAIDKLTKIIASHADSDDRVKQLQAIEGIGPITASALVSTLGNGSQYKSGREFAANLGLVPNQHSSGGKTSLGSITKRGDSYLRTLLVHCARAVLRTIGNKTGRRADWINNMAIKKPFNVVAVALANKTARIVWAILNKGTDYRTDMGIRENSQLMG